MSDVTQLLNAAESPDSPATSELFARVYDELRNLAALRMSTERQDHTLQATALVHEVFLRLTGSDQQHSWESRAHFFAAAAEAMRRILVERARHRNQREKNQARKRLNRPPGQTGQPAISTDVLDISLALDKLAIVHPQKAELVKLRYFAGLTLAECAEVLGISLATANRSWSYARAWLTRELSDRP